MGARHSTANECGSPSSMKFLVERRRLWLRSTTASKSISNNTTGRKTSEQASKHFLWQRNNDSSSITTEDRRNIMGATTEDGDVFIYPPNYRDLNECQKCERDNRICNCIEIEVSSLRSQSVTFNNHADPLAPTNSITISPALVSDESYISEQEFLDAPGLPGRQTEERWQSDSSNKPLLVDQAITIDNNPHPISKECHKSIEEEDVDGGSTSHKSRLKSNHTQQRPPYQNDNACEKNEDTNFQPAAVMSEWNSSTVSGPLNQQVSQAGKDLGNEKDQSIRDSGNPQSATTMAQADLVGHECRSKRLHGPRLSRQAILASEDLNDPGLENFGATTVQATIDIQDHNTTTTATMDLFIHESNDVCSSNGLAILPTSSQFVPGKGGSGGRGNETQDEDKQLDYSPILTGVRDYIEGVNSEIQLSATEQSPTILISSLVPNMLALQPGGKTSSGVDNISSKPLATPAILTTMTLTANTTKASTSSHLSCDGAETSKKSIFDGASKDEILEYLEDARERVPEVLISADEVMVIGENELILVNQLQPNQPATPIAILDSSENVASSTGTIVGATAVQQSVSIPTSNSAMMMSLPINENGDRNTVGTMESPSSLDENEVVCFSGQQSSDNFRSLDSTLLSSIDDRSMALMSPSSSNKVIREFSHFADQSTMESILSDSQIVNSSWTDIDLSQLVNNSTADPDHKHLLEQSTSSISDINNKSVSTQLCISDRVTSMLRHSTRRKSTSESSSRTDARRVERMMLIHTTAHSRTEDSISTSSSSNASTASSTPASSSSSSSSTSNSRSSSSNQTSGNSSATSNFLYNSVALSCSSPLLALGLRAGNTSTTSTSCSTTIGASAQPSQSGTQVLSRDELSQLESARLYSPARESLLAKPQSTTPPCGNVEDVDLVLFPLMFSNKRDESEQQQQQLVDRGDSGLGVEPSITVESQSLVIPDETIVQVVSKQDSSSPSISDYQLKKTKVDARPASESELGSLSASRLSVIDENSQDKIEKFMVENVMHEQLKPFNNGVRDAAAAPVGAKKTFGLGRHLHSHHATINRLNDYLIKRQQQTNTKYDDDGNDTSYLNSQEHNSTMIEFQCLDCDQIIVTEQARVLRKANELRLLRESEIEQSLDTQLGNARQFMTIEQIDRAYVAALNGLPLCKACEKKRGERKEIISEFVETELKYGRDLKIIHDEFYRPMQIAGLLNKDQINGIFLNLDELIMAHCRFAERLELAINEAQHLGDTDFNTVNIGKLFVDSAEMLHTFESYCIRQGTAACLLARLAKEKELLRIFLRVSQMENTLLRRMNLAAFLMVPVQRVTKYPLLLNRLYKVTAYHHKDREALRDAQLKVELHLEHINQQTKGISATNKIWRRISALSATGGSASTNNRNGGGGRGLISAEDIGYIKLRKTAMELLNWDRNQTQFIHSGKISFATLNEYLVKQKMKSLRYMSAHALLIVLGNPNWKYRPDLVKSNLDNKHLMPTMGGNGIKQAALLLFREKNGRFIAYREPLFLSNCVISNDCSQFNHELPHHHHSHFVSVASTNKPPPTSSVASSSMNLSNTQMVSTVATTPHPSVMYRRSSPGVSSSAVKTKDILALNEFRAASAESQSINISTKYSSNELTGFTITTSKPSPTPSVFARAPLDRGDKIQGDSISMSSLKSLPEDQSVAPLSPPVQTSRSYSLASALPRKPITTISSTNSIASLPANSICGHHQPLHNEYKQQQNNHLYSHHFFHNHHQPYGDHQESFEIHECSSKDSFLLRADTTLKTRYWFQMLRYHAKDLGHWRLRRQGLANIMMMRQE